MRAFVRKFALFFESFALSLALSLAISLPNAGALETDQPDTPLQLPSFSDIHEGNYYYVPIMELTKEGIINGYDDGTFKSKNPINRAEALKIAMEFLRKFDLQTYKTPEKSPFSDVPLDIWYGKYVAEAFNKIIIQGYEDGTFRPLDPVNLAEALKLIIKSIDSYTAYIPLEDPFADVSKDAWYGEYALYAADHDMLDISGENKIDPGQEINRGQFTELIYKLKMFREGYHFGKATFYGAAVQGHGTASGKTFDKDAFTAAHKTLPFGTIVEVTNLANGKKINVEITDRGPYGYGRVIDLSSGAFKQISALSLGVINVQYQVKQDNDLFHQ